MKKKLIDSLKALPMTMEDKEKFAEVICSKTSSGGSDSNSIFKWRYYSGELMNTPELANIFSEIVMSGGYIDIGTFIQKDQDNDRIILSSFSSIITGSGSQGEPKGFMISNKIIRDYVLTDFYKVIFDICQGNNLDYDHIISLLESLEITEEEFMEDVVIE